MEIGDSEVSNGSVLLLAAAGAAAAMGPTAVTGRAAVGLLSQDAVADRLRPTTFAWQRTVSRFRWATRVRDRAVRLRLEGLSALVVAPQALGVLAARISVRMTRSDAMKRNRPFCMAEAGAALLGRVRSQVGEAHTIWSPTAPGTYVLTCTPSEHLLRRVLRCRQRHSRNGVCLVHRSSHLKTASAK